MSLRGAIIVVIAGVVLFAWMFRSGMFMHGD